MYAWGAARHGTRRVRLPRQCYSRRFDRDIDAAPSRRRRNRAMSLRVAYAQRCSRTPNQRGFVTSGHRTNSVDHPAFRARRGVLVNDLLIGNAIDDRLRRQVLRLRRSLVARFDGLSNFLDCRSEGGGEAGVMLTSFFSLTRALARLDGIGHLGMLLDGCGKPSMLLIHRMKRKKSRKNSCLWYSRAGDGAIRFPL